MPPIPKENFIKKVGKKVHEGGLGQNLQRRKQKQQKTEDR